MLIPDLRIGWLLLEDPGIGLTDWLPRPRPGIRLSRGDRGEVLGPIMPPGTVRPRGRGDMDECPGETTEGERRDGEIKERLPGETASLPRLDRDLVKPSRSLSSGSSRFGSGGGQLPRPAPCLSISSSLARAARLERARPCCP